MGGPAGAVVIARIVDGAITPDAERRALADRGWAPARHTTGPAARGIVGAAVRFEGIVRRAEPSDQPTGISRDLDALHYQTYDPMAEQELLAAARAVADRHAVVSLVALHSRGRVRVGEVAFVVIVESTHRVEALAAMAECIDRVKRDVPIWKHPVWT